MREKQREDNQVNEFSEKKDYSQKNRKRKKSL